MDTRTEVKLRMIKPDIPEAVQEALEPCMFRRARAESRICQGDVEHVKKAVTAWMESRDVGERLAWGLAYACYWMLMRERKEKIENGRRQAEGG